MTCLDFETVLNRPDDNASRLQLHKLITNGEYSGRNLPHVAETYLHSFCDSNASHHRRRWVGLALAGMLNASLSVVDHIKSVKGHLKGLGHVILSHAEREETRIVAGIIIRQALACNIDFADFWASEKVIKSAPNFPRDTGSRWMAQFQAFLDTLDELALTGLVTDPLVLYPVSIVTSDAFCWANSNIGMPTAIVQDPTITVILPDGDLKSVQFLDIPIMGVESVLSKVSPPLPDSQSRVSSHKPWELVLTLRQEEGVYQLDARKRTASELTFLFQRLEDAKDCEICIKELQEKHQTNTKHDGMKSTNRNDLQQKTGISAPLQSVSVAQPQGSESSRHCARIVCRSDPIEIRRTRAQNRNSSSKQRAKSQDTSLPLLRVRPINASIKAPDGPVHNQKSAQAVSSIRTRAKTKGQQLVSTIGAVTRSQVRSKQGVSNSDNSEHSHTSLPDGSGPEHTSPQQNATGGGKLPKVSQATKQKASQQIRKQPDIFEIPNENRSKPAAKDAAALELGPHIAKVSRAQVKKPDKNSPVNLATRGDKKSRNKRKAEDVPLTKESVDDERAAGKRRERASRTAITKLSKKKQNTQQNHAPSAATKQESAQLQEAAVEANRRSVDEGENPLRTSYEMPVEPGGSAASNISTRAPLIRSLLSSQQSSRVTKVTFKKPSIPTRALQSENPSTPEHPPSRPIAHPKDSDLAHTRATISLELSSPPMNIVTGNGRTVLQESETEILSSNSKPLPASPNAESTAISGHANHDDVNLEKKQADLQTAQMDPFNHGFKNRKTTTFIRRLTGDGPTSDNLNSPYDLSTVVLTNIDPIVTNNINVLATKTASRQFLQPTLNQGKGSSRLTEMASPTQAPSKALKMTEIVEEAEVVLQSKGSEAAVHLQTHDTVVRRSQGSKRKAAAKEAMNGQTKRQRPATTIIRPAHTPSDPRSSLNAKRTTQVFESTAAKKATPLLTPYGITDEFQNQNLCDRTGGTNAEGNTTLINGESDEGLPTCLETMQLHFCSSPPHFGSSSSHSSTSAETEPSPPSPLPTSEAEEREWEASLKPHQRALHDLLIRVSKRVLRHIVDNESAVTDIAEVFSSDGEYLLNQMLQRHKQTYDGLWEDVEKKRVMLKRELETSAKALARERKRISSIV